MRITFVLASGFGLAGGERTIAQWALQLQQRGHDVLVISPPGRKPTWRERFRALRRGVVPTSPGTSHLAALDVPRVLLERHRPVTEADLPDADVVIATWWETAEWVSPMKPAKGVHVHLIQHHEVFDYLPKQRAAAVYQLPFQKIVVAPWLQTVMREQYGDRNVSLISVGIDRTCFDAPPRGKQELPTFGFLYSPLYWKGCDVVLDAIALAKKQLPEMRVIAFGSEDPLPQFSLPWDAFFVKQPPQKTLGELYARCDAWLYGSRTEGFGLPILEAFACRTPVIGTPAGVGQELIPQGGILVPPQDAAAMARAMVTIAEMSADAWRTLSDNAYQSAASWTWERSTDQLEAALELAVRRASFIS